MIQPADEAKQGLFRFTVIGREGSMTLHDALILSYVKRGLGYGYNIMSHVRESRSDEWVDFSRAGLYKILDKLERMGFLEKKLEQDGARPPKKVYTITQKGSSALDDFIENGFDFDFKTDYDFDAYLVSVVASSPDAKMLAEIVGKRIGAVQRKLQKLTTEWPEDRDSYPFIVYALYKRQVDFFNGELEWLAWLERILKTTSGDVLTSTWADITG